MQDFRIRTEEFTIDGVGCVHSKKGINDLGDCVQGDSVFKSCFIGLGSMDMDFRSFWEKMGFFCSNKKTCKFSIVRNYGTHVLRLDLFLGFLWTTFRRRFWGCARWSHLKIHQKSDAINGIQGSIFCIFLDKDILKFSKGFFQTKVTSSFWFDKSGGFPTNCLVDFLASQFLFGHKESYLFDMQNRFVCVASCDVTREKKGGKLNPSWGGRSLRRSPTDLEVIDRSRNLNIFVKLRSRRSQFHGSSKGRPENRPKEMNTQHSRHTVDRWNPANQLRLVVYSHYFTGFYTSQVVGLGISEPSTVLPPFSHPPTQNIWLQDLEEAHFEAQLKNRENDVVTWYFQFFFWGEKTRQLVIASNELSPNLLTPGKDCCRTARNHGFEFWIVNLCQFEHFQWVNYERTTVKFLRCCFRGVAWWQIRKHPNKRLPNAEWSKIQSWGWWIFRNEELDLEPKVDESPQNHK